MAGGLFGRPFVLNEKCIIFSLICMALFLYKPNINNNYILAIVLFIIFVVAYVAMAWYDYFFNCDIVPLKRGGKYSFTGLFKPPPHIPEKQNDNKLTSIDKYRKKIIIYAMHLLFIVPFLSYIVIKKTKINPITYPILGALTIFTASYHGLALMSSQH